MKLLNALRAATRPAHERLHEHAALRGLGDGTADIGLYRSAIAGFYGFYRPYEEKYAAFSDVRFTAFAANTVRVALEKDLAHQGLDAVCVPLIQTSAEPLTLAQATGYLYVREGSTLGGQIISKHLERGLSLQPGVDNFFFHGPGVDTGPSWKRFVALLSELETVIDPNSAAGFSAELFQQLDSWLGGRHAV